MKLAFNPADFKNLRGDPSAWAWPPKIVLLIVAFAVILVGAYFLFWKQQQEELQGARDEMEKLKTTWKEKKSEAINLDLYQEQLRKIDQSFGALLKQLPDRSEMPALLVEVNQAGLGAGLQFELFKPAAAETMLGFYAELPIEIKVSGSYHDIARFASDVAKLSRIVTLEDMVLAQATGKDSARLTLSTRAKTFRYLDTEEVQQQKQKDKKVKK